jgi:nitrogen regulatory protein P-II 1
MKMITAIIQPDKLDEVREALIKAEITRITVSRCTGHGQHQREDQG